MARTERLARKEGAFRVETAVNLPEVGVGCHNDGKLPAFQPVTVQ
jgi:hypothetical protein